MQNAVSPTIRPHLTIRPSSGWAALNVRETWQFRELLLTLAARDLKLRYKQTALGVLWVILQPLAAAVIFAFVFGKVAKLSSQGVPYVLFAYAGLLGWNLFGGTLSRSSGCLVSNAPLISKIFFPRMILPLSTAPAALVDFAVALGLMGCLMALYGVVPTLPILLLPLWMALMLMLALGAGLIASALAVRYRDIQHIMPVLVQLLLYASPVAYAVSQVPDELRGFYYFNPLASLLEAFRWSLLGTAPPHLGFLAYAAAVAVLTLGLGAVSFKRMERNFADVI